MADGVSYPAPSPGANPPKPRIVRLSSGENSTMENSTMEMAPKPLRAQLKEYETQAYQLLDGWRAADPAAIQIVRQKHPRFLDAKIPWLPQKLSESELRHASLDLADAHLTIARWYDFDSWHRLVEYLESVTREGSS